MPKYSISVAGHATSVSVEEDFWQDLNAIAKTRNMSVNQLLTEIDKTRMGNLSQAIRLYVYRDLKKRLHKYERSV